MYFIYFLYTQDRNFADTRRYQKVRYSFDIMPHILCMFTWKKNKNKQHIGTCFADEVIMQACRCHVAKAHAAWTVSRQSPAWFHTAVGSAPTSHLSPPLGHLFYCRWPELHRQVFNGREVRSALPPSHPLPCQENLGPNLHSGHNLCLRLLLWIQIKLE